MNTGKNTAPLQFIEELLGYAEKHVHQAVAVYQNLSPDQLNRPSIIGGWSITQCLAHLNSYFSYYLPLLTKATQFQTAKPIASVKPGWLGNYFIRMMDPDGKPANYKAARQHEPAPQLNAPDVVAAFIDYQESLLTILRQAAQVNLNGNRIPISITPIIRLRLGATLAFLVVHNERHIRQANRNL